MHYLERQDEKDVQEHEAWQDMPEATLSLPQRIVEGQEFERERIAREIHDDLGQSLATLKMLIQQTLVNSSAERFSKRSSQKIVKYLDTIIEKSRHIASGLRPSILEAMGLTRSLKKLIGDFRRKKELKIKSRIGQLDHLRFEGEPINLYRIIQEALTNLNHHAQASYVEIIFHKKKNNLIIVIKDNGRGFNQAETKNTKAHGLGLYTMRERAKLLKGSLDIESQPGCGTTIQLCLPVIERV